VAAGLVVRDAVDAMRIGPVMEDTAPHTGVRNGATRTRSLPWSRALSTPAVVVAGASIVWTAVLVAVAVERHLSVRSHRFDLGNMVQAVWSTAHGRPLDVTLASGEQMSRLGVHVDPILVLFAPLAWLFPPVYVLIVAQVVALASGAVAVYLLGRRHLESETASVLLSLAYLLYPSIIWNALTDFHPVTLAIPLLLWAIYFLDADRLLPFAVLTSLALSTNELIGLGVGVLGLWYALSRGRRRVGLVVAAVGFSWTVVCLKLVVPAFSGGSSVFYDRFASVGGSPGGMLETLVTDPGRIGSSMTTFPDGRYLLALLTPLLGLWLWSSLALAAVPQIAINLLSDTESSTLPQYQYVAGVVPYLFAASVLGLRRYKPRMRPIVTLFVVALTGLITVSIAPMPGRDPYVYAKRDGERHRSAIREALALVPADAAVSTTNRIGGQVSARRFVYSFPVRRNADWVVVDAGDPWLASAGEGDAPPVLRRELAELKRDRRFELVSARDGVLVYRRVSSVATRRETA
jgi:uncharacterized membrane protein